MSCVNLNVIPNIINGELPLGLVKVCKSGQLRWLKAALCPTGVNKD